GGAGEARAEVQEQQAWCQSHGSLFRSRNGDGADASTRAPPMVVGGNPVVTRRASVLQERLQGDRRYRNGIPTSSTRLEPRFSRQALCRWCGGDAHVAAAPCAR